MTVRPLRRLCPVESARAKSIEQLLVLLVPRDKDDDDEQKTIQHNPINSSPRPTTTLFDDFDDAGAPASVRVRVCERTRDRKDETEKIFPTYRSVDKTARNRQALFEMMTENEADEPERAARVKNRKINANCAAWG